MGLETLLSFCRRLIDRAREKGKELLLAGTLATTLFFSASTPAEVGVLMSHGVGKGNRYSIPVREYIAGLERICADGGVTVPIEAYVEGRLAEYVPPGKYPVILTDDDGEGSVLQFEQNPDGSYRLGADGRPIATKTCLYGALKSFAETHPEFNRYLTLFINFKDGITLDDPTGEKLRYLLQDPMVTIGSHTNEHANLRNKGSSWMRADIERWSENYERITGQDSSKVKYFAYPYGECPRDAATMKVVQERYDAAFNAWGGEAPAASSSVFSRYHIPRIEFHNRSEYGQPDTIAWITTSTSYRPSHEVARATTQPRLPVSRGTTALPQTTMYQPPSVSESEGFVSVPLPPPSSTPVHSFSDLLLAALGVTAIGGATTAGAMITFGAYFLSRHNSSSRPVAVVCQRPADLDEARTVAVAMINHGISPMTAIAVIGHYCGADGLSALVEDHVAATQRGETHQVLERFTDSLVPEKVEEMITKEYLSSSIPLEQLAEQFTKETGLALRSDDVSHLASKNLIAASSPSIDSLAAEARRIYNDHVASYGKGPREYANAYQAIQRRLFLQDESQAKGLLQAHVAASYGGDGSSTLSRFDTQALPNVAAYDKELATLYRTSPLTLKGIAQEMTTKYGMRVSASTVSRRARAYLAKNGESVASRNARPKDQ